MKMKIKQVQPADHLITIINVYAPHTGRLKKSMHEVERLYVQLTDLINNVKNVTDGVTIICGDFNAKIGKKTDVEQCMDLYSQGLRNNSGQMLINFCSSVILRSSTLLDTSRPGLREERKLV